MTELEENLLLPSPGLKDSNSNFRGITSFETSKLRGESINVDDDLLSVPDNKGDPSQNLEMQSEENQKASVKFLALFLLLQTSLGFQIGYVFCYTNQLSPALEAKFGWTTDSQKATFDTIVGSSATLTTVFGTLIGGKLIQYGRRRALLISAAIGILGCGLTLIPISYTGEPTLERPVWYTLILGRLLYGLAVGILAIATPRLMEETVPAKWTGAFGACYCFSMAIAVMVADLLASILPKDDNKVALQETMLTAVFFLMPLVMYAIQLFLQFTYFSHDSPKRLIINGEQSLAKEEVKKIYKVCVDDDAKAQEMVNYLESTCQKETSTVTIKAAFTERYYRSGSWVALILMVIHELTGINAILLYSNTILAGNTGGLSPRTGVDIIGVINLISSGMSIWTAKTFTRRALFIWGHIFMGLCHIGVGMSFAFAAPTFTLIAMCMFMFFYQNSSGCITWLYCSEVAVDGALGIVGMSGYAITFMLALLTQPMFIAFGQDITFYGFGVVSMLGAVWCYIYLKETSTCATDKEKKALFIPLDLVAKCEADPQLLAMSLLTSGSFKQ